MPNNPRLSRLYPVGPYIMRISLGHISLRIAWVPLQNAELRSDMSTYNLMAAFETSISLIERNMVKTLTALLSAKGAGFLVASCFVIWLSKLLYRSRNLVKGIGNIPVERLFIGGVLLPRFLPAMRGFNRPVDHPWKSKYSRKHSLT